MLLIPLIYSIEKEVTYNKGQELIRVRVVLKAVFTFDPLKAIRKIAKDFVAKFTLDLKAYKKKKAMKKKDFIYKIVLPFYHVTFVYLTYHCF